MPPTITVLQPGDASALHPYTIVIIANPALETADGSGVVIADPMLGDEPGFNAQAKYVTDVLFGRLPGQAENLLDELAIGPKIRIVSVFDGSLAPVLANALIYYYPPNIVTPQSDRILPVLARYHLTADLVYAITASPDHDRASAWPMDDDLGRGGVPFLLDGHTQTHWFFSTVPGAVALPRSAFSLTGLHEFGHAGSSSTDGFITDQYVDSDPDLNVKRGRPIPASFGTLDADHFAADLTRDGLGYPAGWVSFHPELTDPTNPSLMDDYWSAPGGNPLVCRFDTITRQFIRARLLAKLSRP